MKTLLPLLLISILLTDSLQREDLAIFPKSLRLETDSGHAVLLESVLEHGLTASQHLIEVQEKELYDQGAVLAKSQPAHFLSVFNKQKPQSKLLSKYAYATLHASSLLSRQ